MSNCAILHVDMQPGTGKTTIAHAVVSAIPRALLVVPSTEARRQRAGQVGAEIASATSLYNMPRPQLRSYLSRFTVIAADDADRMPAQLIDEIREAARDNGVTRQLFIFRTYE